MAFLFIVMGAVLLLAGLRGMARFAWTTPAQPTVSDGEEITALRDEIKAMVASLEHRLEALSPVQGEAKSDVHISFAQALMTAEKDQLSAICQAFESGKTITEIAREFQRGKGEVELILNLRHFKQNRG
ncbi:MAG: hypothetical protein D9V47_05760 [Clostridia bacterium]|nr:MAG: hypothetical protein D9V47_05760 [Clostridia bacterium]